MNVEYRRLVVRANWVIAWLLVFFKYTLINRPDDNFILHINFAGYNSYRNEKLASLYVLFNARSRPYSCVPLPG